MFRAVTFLLLIAVVALQMGSRWVVYVAWKANQEYIARELCENRARPELECEGRCCLRQELRKTEEQERKLPRISIPEVAVAPLPAPFRLAQGPVISAEAAPRGQAYPPAKAGALAGYEAHAWQPPEG